MSSQSEQHDVAVVGGGVIGLAVAWRAAQRGLRTLVLDAGEDGAWRYAAGMLAPGHRGGVRRARRCSTSACARAAGFPAFCAELERLGLRPGLRRTGTLVVARDRDEAEELEQLYAYRRKLGLAVERLRPSQARRAEPALAPTVRLALDVPGDDAVDPRRLVAALSDAVEAAGGEIAARARRPTPRRSPARPAWSSPPGAWSRPSSAPLPVRPVKGQIMRLRDPRGEDLVTRTIRTREGYLVPRGEGRYVLGATVEERGWDTAPTAGATLRADPRPRRGRARRARARDRGAAAPACGPARPTTCRSSARRARRRLGDRPLPQRHPAAPTSPPRRSPRCWPARRCRSGPPPCDPARFAEVAA